jgi:hypothetical protein
MMKRNSFILILFLGLTAFNAEAVRVPGLYEAEIPVSDQSDSNRKAAIITALEMVLVKLTGDRYAAGRPDLKPLIRQAEAYVLQFRYTEKARELATDPESETAEVEVPQLLLSVRFDENTLERSLRELSVPLWGRERPSTLLWLVIQKDREREIIGLENGAEYISIIDDRVDLRGISIMYPLLDLEDNVRLRPGDIWGNFQLPVFEASNRYKTDSILTGSIESPVAGIWEGHWTAYFNDEEYSWTTEGDIIDVVLDEGLDGMADLLAAQFVRPLFTEESEVRIAITDIIDINQYADVIKYFESLNSVTNVQVERVEQGRMIFLLRAHGGGLAVAQAITLGRMFEPISGNQGMAYRLVR